MQHKHLLFHGIAIALVLGPAASVYFSGYAEAAHYIGLGSILALQLTLLARPAGAFSVLLPIVYAAAAITAQSTDGVVALVVAIAAAVGAASSQGFHRGLVALLAAALLGSFEANVAPVVLERSAYLLAGSLYGYALAIVALRGSSLVLAPVPPQTALAYAALLATLSLGTWFAARVGDFAHSWWLPLAVATLSLPVVQGSIRRSMLQMVASLCGVLVLVGVMDGLEPPYARGMLLVATLLVALTAGRNRPWLLSLLMTPMLVLLSNHGALHEPAVAYVAGALPAFAAAVAATCLGHFVLWTLRADPGRVVA